MKYSRLFALIIPGLLSAPVGQAQTVLSSGHVDIGIGYEGGAFDLHVHKELPAPDEEFEPGEAILQVGAKALLATGVPNTPAAVSFFGPAGSPLWVLPKTQDEELLFLGIGSEELDASEWTGNLTLTLKSVSGPGDFFVWDTGTFGDLLPKMSSRDGVTDSDALGLIPGSHGHWFLGFSAPGDYEIGFAASGTHATDGSILSDTAVYRFAVVPEPGAVGLLVMGGLVVLMTRRRSARVRV